ncbi:hypothetical protein SAMN05421505_11086 [Sinosporangium album]|uniref:Uncharacterized protein n=1 Tax=Sinosporangium album TaxID=504805 RepID=A0A1G7YXT6_9ACTN|nr:hypothetical protein [Sinosporangium album]SDH00660.1 hypothetical protein SAMN05421505_11086 [Sinosporangium album]
MADAADVPAGYGGWSLESDWPGLTAERDEVVYSADKLKKIAGELEVMLKALEGSGAGSLSHLAANTELSDQGSLVKGVDRWNGGSAFFDTLKDANREFTQVYTDVAARLKAVVSLIEVGAGIYDRAGQANLGKG